ncbi:hypothetical protein BHE74_00055213 [Ensete ventricosum]|nr:hypothetical protein BHE74_00055213 [Ensete ventricosum]
MRRRHCVHYDKAEHHHPAVAKRRKGCEHAPRVRPINRSPRDTPLATLQTPIRTVHPPPGTNLHAPARLPRSNPNTRSYKFLQKAIQRPAPSATCPPSLHLCRPRSPYLGGVAAAVDAEVMEATRALKKGTVGSTAVVAEKWIVVANCGDSRAVLSRGGVAVCNTDGYHLYGAVCTGLPVDRNADRSLPGGTVDWGCFRPVTTRNRPITLDFDRRLSLSGGNGRFRSSVVDFRRYHLREKEEPGVRRYSPNPFARRRFLLLL